MPAYALALLTGTSAVLFASQQPPDPLSLLCCGMTAVLLIRFRITRLAGIALAGACWAIWQAGQLLALQLPADTEARNLQVRGQVQSLPQHLAGDTTRFRFLVSEYKVGSTWQPLKLPLRLNWYRGAAAVGEGELWQLVVKLKQPHGFANPGGFDYERWLFANGIRATGYVRNSTRNIRLQTAESQPLSALRSRLAAHIEALDTAPRWSALIRALIIGDRSGVSADQWQTLQSTGTSHLLAISGLHISLVATLVFFLARRLWALAGGARFLPAPRVAALAAMLATVFYALLSGFDTPAQRAAIMVGAYLSGTLLGHRTDPWLALSLALICVLLLHPLSVLGAGFWLSFSAVGFILLLTAGRYGTRSRVRKALVVQFGLVAALTPALWFWFQQASWLAPAVNLVAIPFVSLLVVPILLGAVLAWPFSSAVADALFMLAARLLEGLWWGLELVTQHAGQLMWQAPPVATFWLAVFAAGLVLMLLPYRGGLLSCALLLSAPALLQTPARPANGDLWLTLLDVGQGLAATLETRRHLLVYDTGPAYRSGFDTGAAVVKPFLHQRGYRHIDRLVISHGDNDHRGGAESLLDSFGVGQIDTGEPSRLLLNRPVSRCQANQRWHWDGVDFEYLSPAGNQLTGNNASCVLRATTSAGRSVLLPGDIEADTERRLLEQQKAFLASEILIAPHHGSRTSSTRAFVNTTRPDTVLFATGYLNRYGFPLAEVLARYREAGSSTLRTDQLGAITIRLQSGRPLQTSNWRSQSQHLWRWLSPAD